MVEKKPAGVLFNTKTKRFHPVIFSVKFSTEGCGNDRQCFHSKYHDEEGFDSLRDASKDIQNNGKLCNTYLQWDWSGDVIPNLICWFSVTAVNNSKFLSVH